jgi:hypothetical protein
LVICKYGAEKYIENYPTRACYENKLYKKFKMIDRFVVTEALKHCLSGDSGGNSGDKHDLEQTSLISLLMHDLFGGEILKTHKKKGWHFYNRIEGKRIDFTGSDLKNSPEDIKFEDIPSSPDETYSYFEDEDYSIFLMKFIWAFEEAVGLDKYKPTLTA